MSTTPVPIVVSLEWAKNLKEAGWPQEMSNFLWASNEDDELEVRTYRDIESSHYHSEGDYTILFADPTAEEILRRLPDSIQSNSGHTVPLLISFRAWSSKGFNIRYADGINYGSDQACVVFGDTLAHTAAAMYCFLSAQGLLAKP